VFALYRERYGAPFTWPVVKRVTRTGRTSERLATVRDDTNELVGRVSRLGRLVREALSAERLAELAEVQRTWDARAEIEALQRERRGRFPTRVP
jgi:hypothetical protein